MALNPQNLKVPTSEEARRNGRKGGLASGKARREKAAIKDLVEDILESNCGDYPQFKKLAGKLGIDSAESTKKLYTMMCIMNSMQKGRLDDLQTIQEILGENNGGYGSNEIEDDPLSKALMEEAKKMDEENSVESVENNEE